MPNLIANLTNFGDQSTILQLPDGTTATLELIYQGATERWIFNLTYGSFSANGVGLCTYPNVLRQWKEILPFGLACVTNNQTDPFDINDFSSGRVQLYLLTEEDVAEIESSTFGGVAL